VAEQQDRDVVQGVDQPEQAGVRSLDRLGRGATAARRRRGEVAQVGVLDVVQA